jgi:hypothetical protein
MAAGDAQTQRLLMAAAFRLVFERTPVVVGGTAEEHWLSGEYHPTDLDLCPRPTTHDREVLARLGFKKQGRHWVRRDLVHGVEFPGDGDDIQRTVEVELHGATATVIGLEDLYLDRLRQATATETAFVSQRLDSVVALRAVWWSQLDDTYLDARIKQIAEAEPLVGPSMARLDRRARREARNRLAQLREQGL